MSLSRSPKGISDEAAEDALAAFDDQQQQAAALAAAEKLWRKYEALPPREGKARLSQVMWESPEKPTGYR